MVEADYADFLKATYENARNRLDDLEQLANYAEQFTDVAAFLSQLALQSNLEAEESAQTRRGDDDEERLRLSTVHQAKGLEYGVVFVIMLCEGLFPTGRSLNNLEALEEERRLFYVATTRARDELYLSYPLLRSLQGNTTLQQTSRFIQEISRDLVDEWHLRPFAHSWEVPRPAPVRPSEPGDEPF